MKSVLYITDTRIAELRIFCLTKKLQIFLALLPPNRVYGFMGLIHLSLMLIEKSFEKKFELKGCPSII